MEALFKIDGCHNIRISSDVPRGMGDPRSVGFQLEYTPLRLPGDPEPVADACGSSSDLPVPTGTKILMSKILRSSEARAIASMLLSAATEAR